jgi:hypothetical protein
MLSKLLLTLAIAASFSSAFAAEEAKPADSKPKTWKDKLILSYHGEFGIVRQDSNIANRGQYGNAEGDLKDFTHFHNPTLGYKLTDTLTLSSSYEFRYADHTGRPKFTNRFYRALLSLSKSKILTEQEYGFQLDAGIARRYFDRISNRTTYGNDRVNVTLTKNWGNNNASLFVQYLANDPKNVTSTETWRRGYEFIPTVNLQLTDKLSFTATDDINFNTPWYGNVNYNKEFTMSHEFNFGVFTYKHNDIVSSYLQLKYNYADTGFNNTGDRMTSEDYDYYVGVAYSVTPKITLTGEMGSVLFETHDKKSGFSNKATKPEFTLYVDAAF